MLDYNDYADYDDYCLPVTSGLLDQLNALIEEYKEAEWNQFQYCVRMGRDIVARFPELASNIDLKSFYIVPPTQPHKIPPVYRFEDEIDFLDEMNELIPSYSFSMGIDG